MKNLIILAFSLTLLGCLIIKGEQTEESKTKTTKCTATRDGETFIFKNSTVRNISKDISDTCIYVTDNTGKAHRLCRSMEIYLKCGNI